MAGNIFVFAETPIFKVLEKWLISEVLVVIQGQDAHSHKYVLVSRGALDEENIARVRRIHVAKGRELDGQEQHEWIQDAHGYHLLVCSRLVRQGDGS